MYTGNNFFLAQKCSYRTCEEFFCLMPALIMPVIYLVLYSLKLFLSKLTKLNGDYCMGDEIFPVGTWYNDNKVYKFTY